MGERIVVTVDRDTCMGTRLCNAIAPQALEYDDALAVTRPVSPSVPRSDEIVEAAEKCPVGAIRLRDPETGREIL